MEGDTYSDFAANTVNSIHNANLKWNAAGSGDLVCRSTTTHNITTYPLKNNRNDITKVNQGNNEVLASIYATNANTTTLYESDINFNVYYPLGTDPSVYDMQSIITHEIGHLLGLYECASHSSCVMYYTIGTGVQRRNLSQDDKNGINYIY